MKIPKNIVTNAAIIIITIFTLILINIYSNDDIVVISSTITLYLLYSVIIIYAYGVSRYFLRNYAFIKLSNKYNLKLNITKLPFIIPRNQWILLRSISGESDKFGKWIIEDRMKMNSILNLWWHYDDVLSLSQRKLTYIYSDSVGKYTTLKSKIWRNKFANISKIENIIKNIHLSS